MKAEKLDIIESYQEFLNQEKIDYLDSNNAHRGYLTQAKEKLKFLINDKKSCIKLNISRRVWS
ncbi:hypothetical protein HUE58_04885 [Candidatus Ruthia endofausta]|uniref:Uncharacterized protein n=1 Tax=Candidatus Ruthia endofausta TaxID=2738852 RepID=A0A6N0HQ35_9GAMM|nr:hypothetical protein [Candidatus Ruthia endofausta]QKQ24454.1 hypothetical protein HUE58_04885 [Candidatus Ruthia endofausta]